MADTLKAAPASGHGVLPYLPKVPARATVKFHEYKSDLGLVFQWGNTPWQPQISQLKVLQYDS